MTSLSWKCCPLHKGAQPICDGPLVALGWPASQATVPWGRWDYFLEIHIFILRIFPLMWVCSASLRGSRPSGVACQWPQRGRAEAIPLSASLLRHLWLSRDNGT